MKFLSILLIEGRKEDLKKKYSNKFDEEVLDFVLGISDLQDFNHKYTDFILKNLDPKTDIDFWVEIGIQMVKDFDKYQKNLEKKDINQYNSFFELESKLEPFKEKEKEKELESQTEKIYEDENFLVLVPKTQEASCKYGSGTKWCVTQAAGGHFERYTKGKQGLYFIIRKKGKQTEPHYKVAVHIDDYENESWWDARDTRMNNEAVTLFKDYFSEIYSKIIEHSKEKRKLKFKDVDSIFKTQKSVSKIYENFYRIANENLELRLRGYDLIPDMDGKAVGFLKILINDELIDSYDVFVNYEIIGNNISVSIGFSEEFDEDPKYDFKFWQGWGIDLGVPSDYTVEQARAYIDNFILSGVHTKIYQDVGFEKYLKKITGPSWRPDRFNYGYTFGKNKGLIKKLVDWLDTNKSGTKLDFLVDIGKLKKKESDGKTEYFHSKSDFKPSTKGYFSSFFASAKNAGILDYEKKGKKFYLVKGPNFDAFKEGKLRVL